VRVDLFEFECCLIVAAQIVIDHVVRWVDEERDKMKVESQIVVFVLI
jgi:hypothetical protein